MLPCPALLISSACVGAKMIHALSGSTYIPGTYDTVSVSVHTPVYMYAHTLTRFPGWDAVELIVCIAVVSTFLFCAISSAARYSSTHLIRCCSLRRQSQPQDSGAYAPNHLTQESSSTHSSAHDRGLVHDRTARTTPQQSRSRLHKRIRALSRKEDGKHRNEQRIRTRAHG